MMVLYASGVIGCLISYCSFAICSSSCMSGDIVVNLLTNIVVGFEVVSMFYLWWCSELSSSERAK
jgi:hypothetical protein